MTINEASSLQIPRLTLIILFFAIAVMTGCASSPDDSNLKKGASTGAAVGAGIGLLFGALTGDSEIAATAAVAGAAAGAVEGGYESYRQDQENSRTQALADAIRHSGQAQPSADPEVRAREELTRFLGAWQVTGWVQDEGQRRDVSASANGTVQMSFFVEMAWVDLKVQGIDVPLWGTSTMGYDERSGYSVSTRFNTVPDSMDIKSGRWDASQRAFIFDGENATTIMRFATPDRFTVDTTLAGSEIESYTFTRN